MKLRATLSLRNECMLAARTKLGFTQAQLAGEANVPTNFVADLEALNYWRFGSQASTKSRARSHEKALRIAGMLSLRLEEVVPPELAGVQVVSKITKTIEASPERVLGIGEATKRFALPLDEGAAPDIDAREVTRKLLATLTPRERRVLSERFGLEGPEKTLDEVGEGIRRSRERVSQIQEQALKKLASQARRQEFERGD